MAQAFTAFFEGWLMNQQNLHEKLQTLSASLSDGVDKDAECNDLVDQVLAHYQQYYQEKTKVVNEDAFLMLSPPWLTAFERTLLWISGFKPSMVFPLIKNSLRESLSDEQMEKIEEIREETRTAEKEVEQAMATVQESFAAPPIFDLIRRFERLVDGEISELDVTMEKFKESMVIVMENADALRVSTVRKLVEILSPIQTVKFLAVAAEFMLQLRRFGLQKDAQRGAMAGDV